MDQKPWLILAITLIAAASLRIVAAQALTVSGKVLTYDGDPAVRFIVDLEGRGPGSSFRGRGYTDEQGEFQVNDLKPGEYVVAPYLQDPRSRYPGGSSSFYTPKPLRITVSANTSPQRVTVRLGPPNRFLEGSVKSIVGGVAVVAQIQIQYPGDTDRFVRFSSGLDGRYRILIPPNARLLIAISAPGYVPSSTTIQPVGLDSDRVLNFELMPSPAGDPAKR